MGTGITGLHRFQKYWSPYIENKKLNIENIILVNPIFDLDNELFEFSKKLNLNLSVYQFKEADTNGTYHENKNYGIKYIIKLAH